MSFRPDYDSDSDSDYLSSVLAKKQNDESDDDFSSLSFGALSSAQKKLEEAKEQPRKADSRKDSRESRGSRGFSKDKPKQSSRDSDSESDFFDQPESKGKKDSKKDSKRNKHAPSEASSKRRVSRIREIPGLKSAKEGTLYQDIRFDAAYGKADWNRIRKDYAFLDEYREKEIKEMQRMLKDKKLLSKMSDREVAELEHNMQSVKSRLDTLKNRDLADKIVGDHKREQMSKMRSGQQTNPYFLKKSEQRKMIQKAKFDSMKAGQREKVMERKRKRRLGKEFKQLEFRNQ